MGLSSLLAILAIAEIIPFGTPTSYLSADVEYEDIENLNATCNSLDNCKFKRAKDGLDLYNCNCEKFCRNYDTCCVDSKYRYGVFMPIRNIKCSRVYGGSGISVFMVDSCKHKWRGDESIKDLCHGDGEELDDPLLLIPVTNPKTGITYKNYFCSLCNDVEDQQAVYWNLALKSRSKEVLGSSVPELHFNSSTGTWVIASGTDNRKAMVFLNFVIPVELEGHVHPCLHEVISSCSWNWTDLATREKCDSYMAVARFYTDDILKTYRNPHCAICNREDLKKMMCAETQIKSNRLPGVSSSTFFAGLFFLENKKCKENLVYDDLAKKCRKVYKG